MLGFLRDIRRLAVCFLILGAAGIGTAVTANAQTTFTLGCALITNLSQPTCSPSVLSALNDTATLTFAGNVPLNGTTFTAPATLTVTAGSYSTALTLAPAPYAYKAIPNASNFPGTVTSYLEQAADQSFNFGPAVTFDTGFYPIAFQASNNHELTALTLPPQQTVYLDFGANSSAILAVDGATPASSISPTSYNKPDAGISAADMGTITREAQQDFANYNVVFTDTQPTSGQYDTIYIGGTPTSLGFSQNIVDALTTNPDGSTKDTLGLARNINVGNSNRSDSAVVFSGLSDFNNPCFLPGTGFCSPNDAALSQVIAHETGHLLGLQHVDDDAQLMYPVASSTAIEIGGLTPLGQIINNVVVQTVGEQDSNAVLLCNVGSSATGTIDCSTLTSEGGYEAFDIYDTASQAIYNGQLVIDTGDSDSDVGALVYDLGTMMPGTSETIDLPWAPSDELIFEAALTEGGELEEFQATYDLNGINGNNTPTIMLAGVPVAAVPEPASLAILLSALGLMFFLWRIRYSEQ